MLLSKYNKFRQTDTLCYCRISEKRFYDISNILHLHNLFIWPLDSDRMKYLLMVKSGVTISNLRFLDMSADHQTDTYRCYESYVNLYKVSWGKYTFFNRFKGIYQFFDIKIWISLKLRLPLSSGLLSFFNVHKQKSIFHIKFRKNRNIL